MEVVLLSVALALLVCLIVLQLITLRRRSNVDLAPVTLTIASLSNGYDRTERVVRDDIAKHREESGSSARQTREELGQMLRNVVNGLDKHLSQLVASNEQRLDKLREATTTTLTAFSESLTRTVADLGNAQKSHMESFGQRLEHLTERNDQRLGALTGTIEQRLGILREESGKLIEQMRQTTAKSIQDVRGEVSEALKTFGDTISKTMDGHGGSQRTQLGNITDQLEKLTASNEKKLDSLRRVIDERLKHIQDESSKKLDQMRDEAAKNGKAVGDGVGTSFRTFNESVTGQITHLVDANEKRMDGLRTAVEEKLKLLQEDNARSLEQMRLTVDEKLQGTLERRLGESFKLVSERLEQVHKGLGEMQTLASGVGDLKRVLTNVKSRGTWGEVQLGTLLEQCLSPEQFAMNVSTKDGGERVEFAVKLPNRGDDDVTLWLPIDAKFPIEDYQRLVEAQERADLDAVEAASKQLEVRIKQCAGDICSKYINPPATTDFGILFLPTEGLFAEVLRRTGLPELIQRECRVVIAGPTTLWSILNSLQMGFRTLAIQKRSSEVWTVLGAVKTEFEKYGEVLAKVQKKLQEASNTVDTAAVRTRAIQRKLRGVQELPAAEAASLLAIPVDAVALEPQAE